MLDLAKPITGDSGDKYATKISLAIDQFLALEEKILPTPPSYDYEAAIERLIKGTGDSLTEEAAKTLMVRPDFSFSGSGSSYRKRKRTN